MPHRRRDVAALVWGLCVARAALACAPAAAGPVVFDAVVGRNPPQRSFVARIDLTNPRVGIVIAPGGPGPGDDSAFETSLQLPSIVARDQGFAVAVNGGFFDHQPPPGVWAKYAVGNPARASNMVMIDGRVVSHVHGGVVLAVDGANHASIVPGDALPPGTRQAIGGSWQIVADGNNIAPPDARHARTAVGITADGKTLVLLVADGNRPGWAAGMTLVELADAMIAQGCSAALNLDGGGSSTMVRRTAAGRVDVVNTPSDGSAFVVPMSVERPVAYVLGVRIKSEIRNQKSESNPKPD